MASTPKGKNEDSAINRIPPLHYLHVLDQNTNVTKVVIGPKTYIRQDNERIVTSPVKMMIVPPRHYCVIEDPVSYDDDNKVLFDEHGQAVLHYGDEEIRLAQKPFPLYPGEKVKQNITPLKIVCENMQLKLRANIGFTDENDVVRTAGDEWMFVGPGTYIPRKEVTVVSDIKATVIRPNQALLLRARKNCVDFKGNDRVTGEEWLVSETGAYLPNAYEDVINVINAHVLTEKKALHMRALKTFVDDFSISRKSGEEWLITMNDTETHIPNVYEEVVGVIPITTLTNRQYCVILDPVDDNGKPQLGKKKLVKGEKSFFLMPGESLLNGIQDLYVLHEDEALICTAVEAFTDSSMVTCPTSNIEEPTKPKRPRRSKMEDKPSPAEQLDEEGSVQDSSSISRQPGDRWMILGPREYVPPVEVKVLHMNKAIPLDENEGIYVRDVKSGKVRVVSAMSYILNENEELWSKELPSTVEDLLGLEADPLAERGLRGKLQDGSKKKRKKTDAVTYRVPHNAAVQIYDYKEKKARVVFGPDLVMLGPDEQFTQLSLSGGKPKKPNMIRSLCLLLGPDFCTDIITVETSDHARLQLQLAYNWHFQVDDKNDPIKVAKLFSVPDFVGDACKAIASRIRGAVAGVQFDDFHKNSAKIIRASVFGVDENTRVKDGFIFPQNNLVITNVDIQSVEPVDQRTRDALQKSVQLAIEITTNSQEASARHEAERLEQEAKGRLERQKINDEAEAERARRELLELQANSAAVESTGQAKAEAQSRAEAARIEGEAAVEQAKLKAEAMKIESEAELDRIQQAREAEIKYVSDKNTLEVKKSNEMAEIQMKMFEAMITSLGQGTLRDIAVSGQENQLKLLQSIGLKSTLITDGNTPINLFNTAQGLVGNFIKNNEITDYQESTES